MGSRLLSVASGSSPLETVVQLSSAVLVIFEHSFYIFDKRRHLQDQWKSVPSYVEALEQYLASPCAPAVREAVSAAVLTYEEAESTAVLAYEEAKRAAFHAYEEAESAAFHAYEEAESAVVRTYEEAVSAAVHPYQGNRSTWMAKLPFERLRERRAKERSQAKMKQDFERSQEQAKQAFRCSREQAKEAFERSQEKRKQEFEQQLAKAELLQRVIQITSQYRLPRP